MAEEQLTIEQRIDKAMAPPPPEGEGQAPVEATQPSLLTPETQTEEPVAEPVETEAVETAEEVVEETVEAEPSAEPAQDAEEISLETLGQLAENIGVDVSDLYKLSIPSTDTSTGERVEVSLGELKDSFTARERSSRAEQSAKELKEQLEADKIRQDQLFQQQAEAHAAALNQVDQMLMAEFNNVPWDNLKTTDPTQWSIKRQEFTERQAAVQNMRQQAAQEYNQRMAEAQQKQQQQMQEIATREQENLLRALPTWRDNEVRQSEQGKMREYLLSAGYSPDEIDQAYDHRTIVLAHKAMQFDAMAKKGTTAKKRVVKIGNKKVLKPGAKRTKAQTQQDAEAQLRAKLKKSGDHRDAAALISQRLNRG
tara:strand:- start:478 stop:1578 length:1101 start_codon:yes stop_codon:yes gene_type:complete